MEFGVEVWDARPRICALTHTPNVLAWSMWHVWAIPRLTEIFGMCGLFSSYDRVRRRCCCCLCWLYRSPLLFFGFSSLFFVVVRSSTVSYNRSSLHGNNAKRSFFRLTVISYYARHFSFALHAFSYSSLVVVVAVFIRWIVLLPVWLCAAAKRWNHSMHLFRRARYSACMCRNTCTTARIEMAWFARGYIFNHIRPHGAIKSLSIDWCICCVSILLLFAPFSVPSALRSRNGLKEQISLVAHLNRCENENVRSISHLFTIVRITFDYKRENGATISQKQ